MHPLRHILFGAIFSLFLFLVYPNIGLIGLLILFLSTFMIDIDHFIYYIYKKRDINLFKAFSWYTENRKKFCSLSSAEKKKIYGGLYIFHGMEFLIILFLCGVILYKPLTLVFVGFLFHLFLDWYAEFCYDGKSIKLSFIVDFIDSRKLKNIDEI